MNLQGDSRDINKDNDRKQGIGRGHWQREFQNPSLRRPHISAVNQSESVLPTTMEHSLEEKKFSLSPQAAEFVPRSMSSRAAQPPLSDLNVYQPIHQYSKSSVQDRIRIAREAPLNVSLPHSMHDNAFEDALQPCSIQDSDMGYYDRHKDNQDNLNDSKKEKEEQNEAEETYKRETCQRLNNIINILIVNPAEFTKLIPPFVNKLRCDENMRCLQMVVINIIEWSIAESNFRYNGARFCKYFDTTLEDSKELSIFSKELFRDLLYAQCKVETQLQETDWCNQREEERDPRKCNGLILFLAELVAQMDESYAFTLGELLVWFITRVLRRPASSSVKYICQALKLAGHVLEKDKSRSKDMENMMRALTELVNNGQVDTHVGNMVNSVHELRKDWGRNESNYDLSGMSNVLLNEIQQQDQLGASNYNSSGPNITPSREIQYPLNQPVMYGPDGKILSAEESKFLQDHIKLYSDDQGSEEAYEDDNYDDEIASAYEEFLRDKPK